MISRTAEAMIDRSNSSECDALVELITFENKLGEIPSISSTSIRNIRKRLTQKESRKNDTSEAQKYRLEAEEKWKEFQDWVNDRSRANWLFRGVADAEKHQLIPKIARADFGGYDANQEKTVFQNFKRRARQYIDTSNMTEWDWLAVAQHHGLPTRLLDWTSNPLVAAYFAVTSHPEDQDGTIYALNTSRYELLDSTAPGLPFDIKEDSLFKPCSHSLRVVSQKGFFTIGPDPSFPLEEKYEKFKKFVIPSTAKHTFARKLFYLGIDSSHIMADIDGVCHTLGWQYKNKVAVGKFNY